MPSLPSSVISSNVPQWFNITCPGGGETMKMLMLDLTPYLFLASTAP